MPIFDKIPLDNDSLFLLARYGLLNSFLSEVICDEITHGINLNAKDQEIALKNYKIKNGIEDNHSMDRYRQRELLSQDNFKYRFEKQEKLKRYYKKHFSSDNKSQFLLRKDDLTQVKYRLLRVSQEGLAKEFFLQITEEGGDLSELSRKYSEGPEKENGGLIGPVLITKAHPVLAERLRSSREGQLIEPFQVENCWLLVRLEKLIPASFDEVVAEQMSSELFQQWLRDVVDERLSSIKEALDQDALLRLEPVHS